MCEFVADLEQRIIENLARVGVSREVAGMVAVEIGQGVARDWAGEQLYIGKAGERMARSARDRAIIRDFKAGECVQFLARRYQLTGRRIWQIINGTR